MFNTMSNALLVAALVVVGRVAEADSRQTDGVVLSIPPVIASGENLVANCSVEASTEDHNLSDTSHKLYFDVSDEFRNQTRNVTLIDTETVQLTVFNVTRDMTGGRIYCLRDGHRVSNATVLIADKLRLPEVPDCTVFNWRRIRCTWHEFDTGIPTSYRMFFSRHPSTSLMYPCPIPSPGVCEFESYNKSSIFRLKANNSLEKRESKTNVSSLVPEYVKPDSVTGLKIPAENVTSVSAVITWKSPNMSQPILFRLNVTNIADGVTKTETTNSVRSSDVQLTLSRLSPFTKYSVSVDCRPADAHGTATGFWSDPRTDQFITLTDVPAVQPQVAAGSFRSLDAPGDKRNIEIFWQEIPVRQRNGLIEATRVTCCHVENCTAVEVPGNSFTASFSSLLRDVDYNVTVSSMTSAGFNTSLNLQPIVIASVVTRPLHPDGIGVTIGNSEVVVRWLVRPGASQYTVYWDSKTCCQGQLKWKTVSGNDTSVSLGVLRDPQQYSFAVSAEYISASGVVTSSGMSPWSSCLHDDNKPLQPPDHFHLAGHLSSHSLTMAWMPPDCTTTGYFSHFVLEYCRKSHISGCDGDVTTQRIVANVTSYVIQDLDSDVTYLVRAKSRSDRAESNYTDYISATVSSTGNKIERFIESLYVLAPLSALAVLVILVICCRRRYKKCMPIKILPPEFDDAENGRRQLLSVSTSGSSTAANASSSRESSPRSDDVFCYDALDYREIDLELKRPADVPICSESVPAIDHQQVSFYTQVAFVLDDETAPNPKSGSSNALLPGFRLSIHLPAVSRNDESLDYAQFAFSSGDDGSATSVVIIRQPPRTPSPPRPVQQSASSTSVSVARDGGGESSSEVCNYVRDLAFDSDEDSSTDE